MRRRRDPIQPRESPGSGDGLSPDWRRAWACCEGWYGRTGVLAAADIEIFTYTTTFQIMQSLRLDTGLGVSRPVNP